MKYLTGKKVTEHPFTTQLRNNKKIRGGGGSANNKTSRCLVFSHYHVNCHSFIHSFIYVLLYPHEWLLLWVLLSKSHIAKLPRRFNVRQREKEWKRGGGGFFHMYTYFRLKDIRWTESEVRVGVLVACRAQVSLGRQEEWRRRGGWLKREKYSWLPQPPIPTL